MPIPCATFEKLSVMVSERISQLAGNQVQRRSRIKSWLTKAGFIREFLSMPVGGVVRSLHVLSSRETILVHR